MKRKITIGIASVMLLAMLVPWASAGNDTSAPVIQTPPPAVGSSTLTDDQKEQVKPIIDKVIDARKELTQKYVDFGKITQEQADYYNQRMEEMQKYRLENGFGPGMGRGCGAWGRGGGWGRQGGWGPAWNATQSAPQTTNSL